MPLQHLLAHQLARYAACERNRVAWQARVTRAERYGPLEDADDYARYVAKWEMSRERAVEMK